ncbi:sensor domain-containing diguanylate cyclase [Roseateles sp. BYS87W]|uniref:Diguanylate cyclase domain-containing protein n=1 Tax=Pelomonas baiyunensis TaxID=3299026 RepID=A0ABW7H535_9BURK
MPQALTRAPWSSRLSLRRLLTLPYGVLVLALVALVGSLSWRAGRDTVSTLSDQLLAEVVSRITLSLQHHVGAADAALQTAFPDGLPAPTDLRAQQTALTQRLWQATSVQRHPHHYVYYADHDGRFLGLWRFTDDEAEVRQRLDGQGPRTLLRLSGIAGTPRNPVVEDKVYEPRERPWYQAAMAQAERSHWTPVYIDFKTLELVLTRTRRVPDAQGATAGVAATDLSLQQVSALLQGLQLSEHAVALVVEADGQLIGASRGGPVGRQGADTPERLNAARSPDALIAAAFAAVQQRLAASPPGTAPHTDSFTDATGRRIQLGYARLDPALGLDWRVIVAAPQSDFLAGVQRQVLHAAGLALLGVAIVLVLGWAVLSVVTRELRALADAARRVGDGVLDEPPEVQRTDELGDLARSFADMQRRLLTDQLTGLSNRGAILRRIEDRILQRRRRGDHGPFAVVFVDLAGVKDVNQRFGHATGDAVLQEVGQRLRAGVRAGDLVARFAGDEFVLLLDSVHSRADAEAARAHLEAALAVPWQTAADRTPGGLPVQARFGVALYPEDGLNTEALLRRADADRYTRSPTPPVPPVHPVS